MVDLCYLLIHLDIQLLLGGDSLMPLLHQPVDPVTEGLADQGVDYADHVVTGQLLLLLLVQWKRLHALGVISCELVEGFYCQSLVLRDKQVLDVLSIDPPTFTRYKVPQMPHSGGVLRWQEALTVLAEELVHLRLAAHFGSKVLGEDLLLRL